MATPPDDSEHPLGEAMVHWQGASPPPRDPIDGRRVRIEALDADVHGSALYRTLAKEGALWTYLAAGPFASERDWRDWLDAVMTRDDGLYHALLDADSREALGIAAYLRIEPAHGAIEIGNIVYSQRLQRTRPGTEAMYLFMARAFDELGYRRYEWKCNALNAASRSAAERLGFRYEGTFRQARVDKGRNRDTAWYSIIDSEWPALRRAYAMWLDDDNFDAEGRQKASLRQLIDVARSTPAPAQDSE